MTIVVYDYCSVGKKITIPNEEIVEIFVEVLSGDETGHIRFADGGMIHFDASNDRMMSFHDGYYFVKGEDIQRWIDFIPSENRTASYERQEAFYGW